MSTEVKRRRGTTAEHAAFTGALAEVTVDTTKDTLVVHDGATAGGFPLAKESDLTAKAPLASPTFTGTPAAPTAAVDTNTTQIATTAMVLAQAASATPIVDGTGAAGASTRYARADHVHPTDTSRAPLASPVFTGAPEAPYAGLDNDTDQLASTSWVLTQASSIDPLPPGGAESGTSKKWSRDDHVHPLPPGLYLGTTVLTAASGTFTTGASTNKVVVRVQAGGGAGGGSATAAVSCGAGSGGSSGSYCEASVAVSPSTGYAYVVGAGGAGSSAATGGAGGDAGIDFGSAYPYAYGGPGGIVGAAGVTLAATASPVSAVIAEGGYVNGSAGSGGFAIRFDGVSGVGGQGGSSNFGGGGRSRTTQGAGTVSVGYGAAGGGGLTLNGGAATAGGAGSAGIIIIFEYS